MVNISLSLFLPNTKKMPKRKKKKGWDYEVFSIRLVWLTRQHGRSQRRWQLSSHTVRRVLLVPSPLKSGSVPVVNYWFVNNNGVTDHCLQPGKVTCSMLFSCPHLPSHVPSSYPRCGMYLEIIRAIQISGRPVKGEQCFKSWKPFRCCLVVNFKIN